MTIPVGNARFPLWVVWTFKRYWDARYYISRGLQRVGLWKVAFKVYSTSMDHQYLGIALEDERRRREKENEAYEAKKKKFLASLEDAPAKKAKKPAKKKAK